MTRDFTFFFASLLRMARFRLRLVVVSALALLLCSGVSESRAQTRPTAADSLLLPELSSREVEILGELEIAFPQMRRQALTGFNPPPRIYQVPRDRQPYVGSYKQQARDLPQSTLLAPQPPPVSFLLDGEPARGELVVGLGTMLSRDVAGRVRHGLGERAGVYAALTYFGLSDFTPFPNDTPDLEAPVESFRGRAGLTTGQDGFNAGIELDGAASSRRIYGARLNPSAPAAASLEPHPDRTGAGLGLSAWIENASGADTRFELSGRYGGSRYELDALTDGGEDPRLRRAEKRLDAAALLGRRFGAGDVSVAGDVTAGALDADPPFGSDYLSYTGRAGIRLRLGDQADLRLAGVVLGYESSARNLGRNPEAALVSKAYIAPLAELNVYPSPGLHAYVRTLPSLETNGLADVMDVNPYSVPEPYLQPTLATVDAEAGGVYFAGPVRVGLSAGYRRAPSYLYFEPVGGPRSVPYTEGFFRAAYELAEIVHVGGDVAVSLPNRLSTALRLRWREGQLTDLDEQPIPFFAPFLAELHLSWRFAGRRGLVQATGGYESVYDNVYAARVGETDRPEELGGFLDIDLEGMYFFQEHIGVYVRVDNLGGDGYARWSGYPEPTWVTRGGLRLRW